MLHFAIVYTIWALTQFGRWTCKRGRTRLRLGSNAGKAPAEILKVINKVITEVLHMPIRYETVCLSAQ